MLTPEQERELPLPRVKSFGVMDCIGQGPKDVAVRAKLTVYDDGRRLVDCPKNIGGICQLDTRIPRARCLLNPSPVFEPALIGREEIRWREIPVVRTQEVASVPNVWRYNPQEISLLLNDQPVKLTPSEERVFTYLWRNFNRVVTNNALYSECWEDERNNNSLAVVASRLRKKFRPFLDDYQAIRTIRAVGYSLAIRQGDQLFESVIESR